MTTRNHGRLPFVAALLAAAAAWVGCTPPPQAPTELSALSAYLFRHFESEERGVLEAGMGNMALFFESMDLQAEAEERVYEVARLSDGDLADLTHPGRDPKDLFSVALVTASAFTPDEHTTVIQMADQTPVEPACPNRFHRHFVEPSNPSCFGGRGCTVLRTLNDVVKENSLMTIPYEMDKDYRWVELEEPGSDQWAILSRSWIEDEAVGESGHNAINQMYSIDVFWPTESGGARYIALWMECDMLGADDALIQWSATNSLQDAFDATEGYLTMAL